MSKESGKELSPGCTASPKERRKHCEVLDPNYRQCVDQKHCPHANYSVNLGQPNLRGGIETSAQSAQWRHWKKVFGIPHGDD